jgi:hypothetical protein
MRSIVCASLLLLLAACTDATPPKSEGSIEPALKFQSITNKSDLTQPQATGVIIAFAEACLGYGKYSSDFSEATLSGPKQVHAGDIQRGWTQKYELAFKISDQPQHREVVDAFAMGHTCYYDFGGGASPGFVPAKSPCAKICGMPSVAHKSAPEMLQLDNPATDGYKARLDLIEKTYRANLAMYEKQAMRGDYQAQRNLAYVYGNESVDRGGRITGCAWRLYIAHSSGKSNQGDLSNMKVDCGALTGDEQERAKNFALQLADSVRRR